MNLTLNYATYEATHPEFDGAVMCVTTGNMSIYLPPGTIHCTITIREGYLYGINFTNPETIYNAHRLLHCQLKSKLSGEKEDKKHYIACLEAALNFSSSHNSEAYYKDAIEGWIALGNFFLETFQKDERTHVRYIWEQFLNMHEDNILCPCHDQGSLDSVHFRDHFRVHHLADPCQSKKRKR